MKLARTRLILGAALLAGSAAFQSAQADTLGLPPAQRFAWQWSFEADDDATSDQVVVLRDRKAFDAWTEGRLVDFIEPPDFAHYMVVGFVGGASGANRTIYRVELDASHEPTQLLVRIGRDQAIAGEHKLVGSKSQFVATPQSALPVRFIEDHMIDGWAWLPPDYPADDAKPGTKFSGQGVDCVLLGDAPGLRREPKSKGIAYREDAEKLARESLTDTELVVALKRTLGVRRESGPIQRTEPRRLLFPQPWSKIDVRRDATRWLINYDELKFKIDAKTGEVKRL